MKTIQISQNFKCHFNIVKVPEVLLNTACSDKYNLILSLYSNTCFVIHVKILGVIIYLLLISSANIANKCKRIANRFS